MSRSGVSLARAKMPPNATGRGGTKASKTMVVMGIIILMLYKTNRRGNVTGK